MLVKFSRLNNVRARFKLKSRLVSPPKLVHNDEESLHSLLMDFEWDTLTQHLNWV